MPETNNLSSNYTPNLFKLIVTIFICLFLYIVVPVGLLYLSKPIVVFCMHLLHYTNISEEKITQIKIGLPIINAVVIILLVFPYISSIDIILRKIPLDVRKEWMNYIDYKDRKIDFYRQIIFFRPKGKSILSVSYYFNSRILDKVIVSGFQVFGLIIMLISGTILFFIYISYNGEDYFQYNVLESQNLLNYLESHWENFQFVISSISTFLLALATTLIIIMVLFLILEMIPTCFFQYLFTEKTGIIDASDVPISFIKAATQQLEEVNFLETSNQIQHKKNQISNFISYSLECVKVDKEIGGIDYMNFCFLKCRGLRSVTAFNDIIFRLNRLYEKMDNTLIEINHMNCLEDKGKIMEDLEIYLKIIESKDLSRIKPKEFVINESTIDRAFHSLSNKLILPLIVAIFAQILN